MIRTRDFILFAAVFVFLLMGVSLTVVGNIDERKSESTVKDIALVGGESISAYHETSNNTREDHIVALQKKIAAGEGQIAHGEPVLTSVDDVADVDDVDDVPTLDGEIELTTDRSAQYCDTIVENQIVHMWDTANTIIDLVEGARVVKTTSVEDVLVGTSTVSTTTEKILLQLPINQRQLYTPTCLDSRFVGVALDGSLIENNETWRFRNISSKSIVGYARDGHPIYGPGTDETTLDRCGGVYTSEGYKYYIRERELFVLGCFASTPANYLE